MLDSQFLLESLDTLLVLLQHYRDGLLPLGADLEEMLVELHGLIEHGYEFRYVNPFGVLLLLALRLLPGLLLGAFFLRLGSAHFPPLFDPMLR